MSLNTLRMEGSKDMPCVPYTYPILKSVAEIIVSICEGFELTKETGFALHPRAVITC